MVTRLVGGLTPEDGGDPRTFPAIFNDAVDDLEAVQSGLGVVESGLTSLGGTVVTQGSAIFVQGEAISVLEGTAVALGSAVFDLESDLSSLELGDLADVTIGTAVADGNVLAYSTAVSGWVDAAAAAGGGKILQVVSVTEAGASSASVTAGSYAATGLSASITPSSTASKILVRAFVNIGHATTLRPAFALKRGSTLIAIGDAADSRLRVSAGQSTVNTSATSSMSQEFLDSPSSTSSLTYSVDFANLSGETRLMVLNRSVGDEDGNSIPRAVSTITLMEVAG